MQPLTQLTTAVIERLEGVLFDLDDTFLDGARLRPEALDALYRLEAVGLQLVPVTGRSLAWARVLARQWPVAGVVAENGRVAAYAAGGALRVLDRLSELERAERRAQLLELAARVRRVEPELLPTSDAPERLADFTFDIAETRTVASATVARAIVLAQAHAAAVVRSSIHLHLSLDWDDKATGALRFLSQVLGTDPTRARYRYLFVGDSENDAPGFAAFEHSVAVANLRGRPTQPPRYIARGARSAGFVELAQHLVAARTPSPPQRSG